MRKLSELPDENARILLRMAVLASESGVLIIPDSVAILGDKQGEIFVHQPHNQLITKLMTQKAVDAEVEKMKGMIYSEMLTVRREIVDDKKEYFKVSLDKFNEFANQVISDNKKSGKGLEKDSDYKGFSFDGIPVICDHTLPPNTIMVGNVSELEKAATV